MGQIVTSDWTARIMGSVCTDGGDSGHAIKPPTGHVFIGFTVLAAATFDATGGLVAEDENAYANTDHAAGDLAAGSETTIEGSGGVELDASNSFPAGVTIYGRYTEIDVAGGTIIAYWGK